MVTSAESQMAKRGTEGLYSTYSSSVFRMSSGEGVSIFGRYNGCLPRFEQFSNFQNAVKKLNYNPYFQDVLKEPQHNDLHPNLDPLNSSI